MSLSHTQNVLVKLFKFQQGTLTTVIIIIIFWNISSGISLKLEKKKKWRNFSQVSIHFHSHRHPLQQTTEISLSA